ncbi:MarR family winged helix-turn-helix transcriptional regulator [Mesonia maritima]|uniref:DNA-binding MarR family transcriptional regulator n=1 Tax=Mesonia maritima TaxID=1793873 RepID=A0ABU1K9F8_9FLAO|nr:MarR family transcriptional regulator [Mesonia maritima]MDR6301228.1 DNA-binding MarR family transcriptional regulator [Mesonia maritima]
MKIEEILKTSAKLSDQKKLVILLQIIANESSSQINSALKPFEVSIQQFNVLRILRGQKGKPANLQTIQDRMVNKMSNTTRLVDKLIEKNLVDRCICEENRRKVEIFITEKGLKLLAEIDPLIEDKEKEITQNLNQNEITQLNSLLEKLNDK